MWRLILAGTSHIYQSLWENLTRVVGSGMGEMIQAQQSQHQPTATPSSQVCFRDLYIDWALAVLM